MPILSEKERLLRKIQACSFALVEANLYLDSRFNMLSKFLGSCLLSSSKVPSMSVAISFIIVFLRDHCYAQTFIL